MKIKQRTSCFHLSKDEHVLALLLISWDLKRVERRDGPSDFSSFFLILTFCDLDETHKKSNYISLMSPLICQVLLYSKYQLEPTSLLQNTFNLNTMSLVFVNLGLKTPKSRSFLSSWPDLATLPTILPPPYVESWP